MDKYNYTEEEIINYVNSLKVSDDFLNELESNTELQKMVANMKNDLFIMENTEDSNMLQYSNNKPFISIKNSAADYILYFTRLTQAPSRGSNHKNEVNDIYIYKNIEVGKNKEEYYININNIKNRCIIEYNGEKTVNITGEKDNYFSSLKNGSYNIKIDNYECNINIE